MIKIKMIELLNAGMALDKLYKLENEKVSIQFSVKLMMLMEELTKYTDQYFKKIKELIDENEIEIIEGQIVSKSEVKLKKFLNSKFELDNMEIEINKQKVVLDKNINDLDSNELVILTPFFDYGEFEQEA